MPATAIALGIGHPPDTKVGVTTLDVHLHLDFPEGPLSLGERSGSAPDVGVQVTLQEIAERHEAHVRACGCEWLLSLAIEEKQRGRRFTPQEILARQPASSPQAIKHEPTKPLHRSPSLAEALPKIREAIATHDFEALEGLRDVLNEEIVQELVQDWNAALPWKTKDAFAALLQDQMLPCVQPLFRDALQSPTVETRAYALCVLTGDFTQFGCLLTKGWVDSAKVDAAMAKACLV